MKLFRNGIEVDWYQPTYQGRKIVVAIDSSKSNSAIVVGDIFGNILDDYEIDGSGSEVDVYELCWDTRKQLLNLFKDSEISIVGIEDIITKKSKDYKGLDTHMSRAKITAVFNSFIMFFQDYHNINPILVPNQSWKKSILPDEFRKADIHKGSKQWFDSLGGRWSGRKDDVTDAVCIYMFLLKNNKIKPVYDISETEPTSYRYDYSILPVTFKEPESISKVFNILNEDSLIHNIETVVNRLDEEKKLGVFTIPIDRLSVDDIYSDKMKTEYGCSFDLITTNVKVCVCRF